MILFNNKQKKGSLQLSINAIVVLVMAMVVLGLGLGFIRNLISQGEDKLGGVMSNIDLSNPASATNPITVLPEVELKRGGSTELQIGYYNVESTTKEVSPSYTLTGGSGAVFGGSGAPLTCVNASGTPFESGEFGISAPSASVPSGGDTGFLAVLTDGCAAGTASAAAICDGNKVKAGTYTCKISIYDGFDSGNPVEAESKQIIIYVSN